jgi:hypothetical protein
MSFFMARDRQTRRSGGDENGSWDGKYRVAHKIFCSAAPWHMD